MRHDGEMVRNIGIMAHIDAGKTTTTERVLYYTGRTRQMGEVDSGTSQMDWMDLEKERGITITAASTYCSWKDHRINIIDTPGHVDFSVEVERSLRILDGAIFIFCAVAGVQSQSEAVWKQASRYQIPRLIFINKMDRRGAVQRDIISELHKILGARAVPIQVPIGIEKDFRGVVDLIRKKAFVWEEGDQGLAHKFYETAWDELEPELKKSAELKRQELLEELAQWDEQLFEAYAAGQEVPERQVMSAVKQLLGAGTIYPVLYGSALKNKGIQPLLDAVVDFLPSPWERPPVIGSYDGKEVVVDVRQTEKKHFAGLAFKVVSDVYSGKLTYLRVYAGKIQKGDKLLNVNMRLEERVDKLVRMHANKREEIDEVCAGDIAAACGLKSVLTGHSLSSPQHPLFLETMVFPQPVLTLAVEPVSQGAEQKLKAALQVLAEEDPSFRYVHDQETGQMLLSGMGELHLAIVLEKLKRDHKVQVRSGRPEVAYKETITRSCEVKAVFDREYGLRKNFAGVRIRLVPDMVQEGIEFVDKTCGAKEEYVLAVQQSLHESMGCGVLAGFPVVDIKVELLEIIYDAQISSEGAFKIAASMAFKRGLAKAGSVLLEPIMNLEVVFPEEYMGEIMTIISSKTGRIEGVEDTYEASMVKAFVPLRELFDFADLLRSRTKGRAGFSMKFAEYQKTPVELQRKILDKTRHC